MKTISAAAAKRLEEIRGGCARRSPTVRALAAYAGHADCRLATLGFAAGVDFDRLLAGTRYAPAFGQSPFAFSRGLSFEGLLRDRNYALTVDLLRTRMNFPIGDAKIANLRDSYPKDRTGLSMRAQDTRGLIKRIVDGRKDAPNLIDGAVLRGVVGGVEAFFEADALAARSDGELHVAEVKSFPKVDGKVDADKAGAAFDQVAIYVHLASETVADLGGDPDEVVSTEAMLITPQNVGLTPTLSAKNIRRRIERAAKVLASVPPAAEAAASVSGDVSFGPVGDSARPEQARLEVLHDLADRVGTAYTPSCLSGCGNGRFCRARAGAVGAPCLLGTPAVRLLAGVRSLGRAEELSRGAPPAAEEVAAAALLARAGRLADDLFPAPSVASPAVRRPA